MERLFEPERPDEPRSGDTKNIQSLHQPLAARMRPTQIEDFVGQEHILGTEENPLALRRSIAAGHPHSMILYGPPGSGKTTLARIIAAHLKGGFHELSAVDSGRADVRATLANAKERLEQSQQTTVLFLDEIHRFNKAQQDSLLPAVEDGLITLVGATTENPAFEVNAALLSRMQVYELKALTTIEVKTLLERATSQLFAHHPAVTPEALEFLAERADGDARIGLAALEFSYELSPDQPITLTTVEDALQRRAVRYDKAGDQHYDMISAWIKATRASDPDASLYYLAVMLEGGEDPRFITRRMMILASEDIGNADPQALSVAVATAQTVERVGMPECQYALAQAAIYLSLAPKSNAATRAIQSARSHINLHGVAPPPSYLRAHAPGASDTNPHGSGYDYPHNHPGHVSPQPVMPAELRKTFFYQPDEQESGLLERLKKLRGS